MNEGLSTKDAKKLNKASMLSHSSDPKDQDRARARRTEIDYKNLLKQINARKKMKESFTIDKSAHKSAQKKAKLRNLAKGNTNPNEKAAAEKKAGGPKLYGEGKTFDQWKKAAAKALGKKKEERTAQKAMDAGARLRRKKQRQEYAAKISGSEDNVPDDIRD